MQLIVADQAGGAAPDPPTAPAAAATATVPAERRKYGRYLPWQRANVAQVPLPFVNDMDTCTTYEMTGANRVAINLLGPAMSKWQATGHTCIRAEVPPPPVGQVQPIDRGEGRQIKIYMGQEGDAWLDDDDNLQKWENNELTASDRRVLIATWFYVASIRAGKSAAIRKYP